MGTSRLRPRGSTAERVHSADYRREAVCRGQMVNSASSIVSKTISVQPDTTLVSIQTPHANKEPFSQSPLSSIVDSGISHRQFRILSLLRAFGWDGKGVDMSFAELGRSMKCKRRAAMRDILELEKVGYLRIERRYRQTSLYFPVLMDESATQRPANRTAKREACLKCHKLCVRSRANGWCRKCEGRADVARVATQAATRAAESVVDRRLGKSENTA